MEIKIVNPRASINKAFLKAKPKRQEIELFKSNIARMMNSADETESEEFHKNLASEFLKKTYYDADYFINTYGRNDLVIHNSKGSDSPVGVLIEAKKPTNKGEMLSKGDINLKAFHELILYYLRERLVNRNLEIKYLIVTNLFEWFICDATEFEKNFIDNKEFRRKFLDFNQGGQLGKTTDFFYNRIAKPYVDNSNSIITFTYFDLRDYQNTLNSKSRKDDSKLIPLYKIFSPEHLLKLPFLNDSNSLDKRFYAELLHILGLVEFKKGGKILIGRKEDHERNPGTIIESTITQLDSLGLVRKVKNIEQYGSSNEEQLFGLSLELTITWINRILFLKLLESQLLSYHKKDTNYSFLNIAKVNSYDELNTLFFQVLAKPLNERSKEINNKFIKVPYLNSSLFDPTELEYQSIYLSNLPDGKNIPIFSRTVLKDSRGKKRIGKLNLLEYLFEFLESYDFSSEGAEDIQEENKSLINAAVLGLIFEKINGYKDGAFFTPGFITMFMCETVIRQAVIHKFNDEKGWSCESINDIYNQIEDRVEANRIINSITICDPAVGSGHFLVSALNELIVIKHELRILNDTNGNRLKEYHFEIANDELLISDEDGEFFEYNPKNRESQRVQKAIFYEKQTLIENSLFGVDVNPNSVKICRLRLWIELLKNAYYKNYGLETLPNIDINIKCGNSLVHRYDLDAGLGKALKSADWTIETYREAVDKYRNAQNKDEKSDLENLIEHIKNDFQSEISANDRKVVRLRNIEGELLKVDNQVQMFDLDANLALQREKKISKLKKERKTLQDKINELNSNKIYRNAFEWRFEFPEVLDLEGNYIGFDAVIGNPPYVYRNAEISNYKDYFKEKYFATAGNFDLYKFFIELSVHLLRKNGTAALITNSSFLLQSSFSQTRQFILDNSFINKIVFLGGGVFDEAVVDSAIVTLTKSDERNKTTICLPENIKAISDSLSYEVDQSRFAANEDYVIDYLLNDEEWQLVNRLRNEFPTVESEYSFGVGINTGYIKKELTSDKRDSQKYHPMVPGTGISKWGGVRTDGFIMYDKDFVRAQGGKGRTLPDEKYLNSPKILVVRTRNITLSDRVIATIDYDKNYNLNRLSNIISEKGAPLEGLLGILNSKLYNWLYSKRYFDYEIKPVYLKKSPLCNTHDKALNNFVKNIMSKRKKDNSSDISAELSKLNTRVYELFKLSNDEIDLIEEFHSIT